MTDATHAVTQSALEAIIHEYLKGLGGTIREDSKRWYVHLPTHVDIDFTDGREFEIALGDEETEEHGSANVLSPTSEFTQQILDEAAGTATVGQIALTDEVVKGDYQYPSWITESEVEVDNATFSSYYDKTAICLFVRVGIETVSEYQTQFLEAISLDVEAKEQLPYITEILLNEYYSPKISLPTGAPEVEGSSVATAKLESAITAGQELAVEGLQNEIAEIRESASHAANSEFEEYRQLQEQRITELQTEIKSLSNRLQTSAADVDEAQSRQRRVDALEKRRKLKEQKEALSDRFEEILAEKENDYVSEWKKIYKRHSIGVRTKPIALTLVTYEQGEIELTLSQASEVASMRVPYAIGVGVTDHIRCNNCHTEMSEKNRISVTSDGIKCWNCR